MTIYEPSLWNSNKYIKNSHNCYDYFLNDKYKVKINQKTLERVKNYFR